MAHGPLHPSQWSGKTYIITSLLFLLLISLSPKGLIEFALMKQEATRLEQRRDDLREEVRKLRADVEHFQKSTLSKEKAIREELGYLKADELSLEILSSEAGSIHE